MKRGNRLRHHRLSLLLLFLLPVAEWAWAQDAVPQPASALRRHSLVQAQPLLMAPADTVPQTGVLLPAVFRGVGANELEGELEVLEPFFDRLRRLRAGAVDEGDSLCIVHIGDSHVRGHIYPQTAGERLRQAFGAVRYEDRGVNGATCLTFTHPERVAAIAALRPELLILSFGTNESHSRHYLPAAHYRQMEELVELLQAALPGVPLLLTTPPGAYETLRQRKRRRTYVINPRTVSAVRNIRSYAAVRRLPVWDLYAAVGGERHACANWTAAGLMRPDHVHYLPEGYVLQGELLSEAIIKAYNAYVAR